MSAKSIIPFDTSEQSLLTLEITFTNPSRQIHVPLRVHGT